MKVFQALQNVLALANTIKTSGIGETEEKMDAICSNLLKILTRLKDGNVRVGIIGLTKAGKSTFLNALLGDTFLPASIQPQTANETVIIHDMSKPDGELYCRRKGKSNLLASGKIEINKKLFQFNEENRENKTNTMEKCDKLLLYAPLRFLIETDVENIKLELSDTPGFGEAGAKKVAASVNLAVKELCAFIWILNSNNLKTISEMNLLTELKHYHGELFSDSVLNRVLILINGHTNLYQESRLSPNSASVTPEKIPEYVSNYFDDPKFLGLKLAPEKFVLFNALWALRSREWSKTFDPSLDNSKILYEEAMLMLRYLHEDGAANIYEKEMTEENIKNTLDLLQKGSNIGKVESLLHKMVVENGGLVLLASSVDDTISVIKNSLAPAVKELIQNELIETRKNEVQSVEHLDKLFQDMFIYSETVFRDIYLSILSSSQAHVSAFHDTIKESLSNVVSSKLINSLADQVQVEDKAKLMIAMKNVRDCIPSAILTKFNQDWLTVSSTIKTSVVSHMKNILMDIKSVFLSSLSKVNTRVDTSDTTVHDLVEGLLSSVPVFIESIVENANLVPDFSLTKNEFALSSSEPLQDNAINLYIVEGKTQKFKTRDRKECSGGGWFGWGKSCVHFTEAIPYDQIVYSPNINAFKSAFDDTIEVWMNLYDKQVEEYQKGIANSSEITVKNKLFDVLQDPQQMIAELLQSRLTALNETRDNIAFLEQKQQEVKFLEEKVRKSIV